MINNAAGPDPSAAARRDSGPGAQDLFHRWLSNDVLPAARQPFRLSVGSSRVAILDADYIMRRVKSRARLGYTPWPADGPLDGRERAFASSHVLTELYQSDPYGHRHKWDKLAEQSRAEGWLTEAEVFQEVFERDYRARITFVDVSGMFEDHVLVEKVRRRGLGAGASDAPTAQLAALLSRTQPIVYAYDRHLWKPGVAPRHLDAVVTAGLNVDVGHTMAQGVIGVGWAAGWAVNGATGAAAGLLRVPKWVTLGSFAGGLILWSLFDRDRRRSIAKALAPALRAAEKHMDLLVDGLGVLADAVVPVEPDERIECRIAQVLARHIGADALLAKDIQAELAFEVPGSEVPTVNELRSVLTAAPCFVDGPRYRYSLGVTYPAREAETRAARVKNPWPLTPNARTAG